jgi:hypothetical protein
MVVWMSCWALETCLTYVPRQRRRCSREKVVKKLTTINLPGSSSELAVGVHLVTHPILQRDHISRSDLARDLGRGQLQVSTCTAPDLSGPGRSLRRHQMGPRGI